MKKSSSDFGSAWGYYPGVEPLKDFRYATDLIEFIKTEAPHFEVIGAAILRDIRILKPNFRYSKS